MTRFAMRENAKGSKSVRASVQASPGNASIPKSRRMPGTAARDRYGQGEEPGPAHLASHEERAFGSGLQRCFDGHGRGSTALCSEAYSFRVLIDP